MVSQAVSTQVRAEDIVGLRTLVSQVILEERDKIVPVSILQDVEEIKRSPVGAVIRCQSCGCQVLQTCYLSIGPKIEGFEQAFASYVDAEHAVGVKLRRQRPALGYH